MLTIVPAVKVDVIILVPITTGKYGNAVRIDELIDMTRPLGIYNVSTPRSTTLVLVVLCY